MRAAQSRRILLATIGSLGDLHPMLALALELKQRGHSITVASTGLYRERVEALGLGYRLLRPDWDPTDPDLIAQCEEMRSGPEVLFRKLILPHLRDTYDDLHAAALDTDLMVVGEIVYPAPLIAEQLGTRWASVILSPLSFVSVYDPSLLVNAPEAYRLRRAGPLVNRAMLEFGKLFTRHWWQPVRDLRRELGLRPQCDPVFCDKFSPHLVLALFSQVLARSQPDWPRQTLQPGFVFHDRGQSPDSPELAEFLAAGEPPIVFTLGSTAVHNPGNFYEASLVAARQMHRRALLIGPKSVPESRHGPVAEGILTLPYARYSQVFPHAAVIVHQGGSGTTGQALRAGRPQLIVPYGWDQPDNGARIERLGAGLCLPRHKYSRETAAQVLTQLTQDGNFSAKSAEAARQVQSENGLTASCDALERILP
jgi:rhamnosyltransferase subunit B